MISHAGQQLAGLALPYMAAATIVARTMHFKVAVRPGSLEDAHQFWEFFVVGVIAAPLYEEVLFRGMLTSALDWPGRRWATVLASGAAFTVPHMFPGMPLVKILGPLVIGMLLAWSFLRTRSVLTSFAVHSICNLGLLIKDLVILRDPGFVRRILGYE